ncbi:hypothetical protein [Clostridium estertheticum]|uniref:hypothetical protein n=1 Tax=Clostridium estertheticum TaxID=238834 RepID=UPI00217ED9E1|nr:hypothetical protein [Clostridium estertheticum]
MSAKSTETLAPGTELSLPATGIAAPNGCWLPELPRAGFLITYGWVGVMRPATSAGLVSVIP